MDINQRIKYHKQLDRLFNILPKELMEFIDEVIDPCSIFYNTIKDSQEIGELNFYFKDWFYHLQYDWDFSENEIQLIEKYKDINFYELLYPKSPTQYKLFDLDFYQMITENSKQKILEAQQIEPTVSAFETLKKSGKDFVCKCSKCESKKFTISTDPADFTLS